MVVGGRLVLEKQTYDKCRHYPVKKLGDRLLGIWELSGHILTNQNHTINKKNATVPRLCLGTTKSQYWEMRFTHNFSIVQ